MKKVPKSRSHSFNAVELYLDDLEEIIDILKDSTNELKFESSGYELENLSEISELNKELLYDFRINTRNPYVSVEFSDFRVSIYVESDSPEAIGLFEKVKEVIQRCERPLQNLIRSHLVSILFWIITNVFLLIGVILKSPFFLITAILLFIGVLFWGYLCYKLQTSFQTYIYPGKRIDHPSFLKRHKDQILLAFISAMIGSIITIVFTKMLK